VFDVFVQASCNLQHVDEIGCFHELYPIRSVLHAMHCSVRSCIVKALRPRCTNLSFAESLD
jgi:hypothetical protein